MAKSLESLFRELHDTVRAIDGLHAGDALDELCKVIHGRLVAEGAIPATRGPFDEPLRLSDAAREAVERKLGRRRLGRGGSDVKGRAFQRVLAPAIRAGMGQYFTPEPIVRLVVDVVRPRRNEAVLDPFAGSGRFLAACRRSAVRGIEKSERMARIAGVDLRLRGVDPTRVLCADALLPFDRLGLAPASFDVVLTNPPFGSLLGREALERLGRFELASGRRAVPLEVLGLERCVRFLRPGGRLGIVLPEGVLGNRNTRHVRTWMADRLRVRAIVGLPVETFAPYGAGVKTCVLLARRWRDDEDRSSDHDVCLVRVGAVGYDAAGRERDADDLPEAVAMLHAFLDDGGW
jgi:type I restriction enzyme M protein